MKKSYYANGYKKIWIRFIARMSIFLIIILLLAGYGAYVKKGEDNPKTISTLDEFNMAQKSGKSVRIVANDFYDLNVTMEADSGREKTQTKGHFIAIKLDAKILTIYLSKKDYDNLIKQNKPYIFKGNVYELKDKDLEFFREYYIKQGAQTNEINSILSSNYLNMQDYSSDFYYIMASIIFLIMLIFFVPFIKSNVQGYRSLVYYSKKNFKSTLHKIDEQISSKDVFSYEFIKITKDYIIIDEKELFLALPINQLMWIYVDVKKFRNPLLTAMANGRILNFVFSNNTKYTIILGKNGSNVEKTIDEILGYIKANCPRTFSFYTADMAYTLKKNPVKFIKIWKYHIEKLESTKDSYIET